MKNASKIIIQNNIFNNLHQRFAGLPARDQKALMILGMFLVVIIAYLGIWKPSKNYLETSLSAYETAELTYREFVDNRDRLRAAAMHSPANLSTLTNDQSLLSLISSSAKKAGIVLQRIEPNNSGGIRASLEQVAFKNTMVWLFQLTKEYQLTIEEISIEKQKDPGMVNIRVNLGRS